MHAVEITQWKRANSGRTHKQTLRSYLDHVSLSHARMTGSDHTKPPSKPKSWLRVNLQGFAEATQMGVHQCDSIIQFIDEIAFIFVYLKPWTFSRTVLYYFYRASIRGQTWMKWRGSWFGWGIKKQACKGKRTDIDFFPKDRNSPKISAAIII